LSCREAAPTKGRNNDTLRTFLPKTSRTGRIAIAIKVMVTIVTRFDFLIDPLRDDKGTSRKFPNSHLKNTMKLKNIIKLCLNVVGVN
jgi:hypothetical protein